MKKEQLYEAIGEIDDGVLERYRDMDARLSHRIARKKRTVRVLAIAACLVLVLSLCLPIPALMHPAGNAVLRGDSQALTQYLTGIDGFAPWQEKTAEALEQTLPGWAWEALQTTPVLNVLTQSQYPVYAWKNATFAPYLQNAVHLTYEVSDSQGRLLTAPQIDVRPERYQDDGAAQTYTLTVANEAYTLGYAYSETASLEHQAVHVYRLYGKAGAYYAYVDVQSGECVYWESPERAMVTPEGGVSEQSMTDAAYAFLAERVRDPEAYEMYSVQKGEYFVCTYTRVFYSNWHDGVNTLRAELASCDGVTLTFDRAGNMISFDAGYLGALRYADVEIPEALYKAAQDHISELAVSVSSRATVPCVVITRDGRLALDVSASYLMSPDEYAASAKYLTYLTEPASDLDGYEMISDGKPAGLRVQLSVNYYAPSDATKNNLYVYAYDERGNMTCEVQYLDGVEFSRRIYTYDQQNRLIREEFVYEGTIYQGGYWIYEYDQADLVISKTHYDLQDKQTAKTTYDYDTQGRWICQSGSLSVITRIYDENGNFVEIERGVSGSTIWSHRELIFDKDGNLIKELSYKDGEVYSEYTYQYNADGKETRREAYVDGALVSAWDYEYRDDKLIRTVVYDGSAKITGIETYEYNEFGECTLADYRDARGKVVQTTTYEFGTVEK